MAHLETYLEHYLESISDLPSSVRRNFGLIRELDQQSRDGLSKIEAESRVYFNALRKSARKESATSLEQLASIQDQYKTLIGLSEQKIQYAQTTYKLIDQYIQKLDTDLRRFAESNTDVEAGATPAADALTEIVNSAGASVTGSAAASARQRKRGRVGPPEPPVVQAQTPPKKLALPRRRPDLNETDMPVDPHEPTYCICDRVSFGEMVACDNDECEREWFHFECVGLASTPRGKWLCPLCRKDKK